MSIDSYSLVCEGPVILSALTGLVAIAIHFKQVFCELNNKNRSKYGWVSEWYCTQKMKNYRCLFGVIRLCGWMRLKSPNLTKSPFIIAYNESNVIEELYLRQQGLTSLYTVYWDENGIELKRKWIVLIIVYTELSAAKATIKRIWDSLFWYKKAETYRHYSTAIITTNNNFLEISFLSLFFVQCLTYI